MKVTIIIPSNGIYELDTTAIGAYLNGKFDINNGEDVIINAFYSSKPKLISAQVDKKPEPEVVDVVDDIPTDESIDITVDDNIIDGEIVSVEEETTTDAPAEGVQDAGFDDGIPVEEITPLEEIKDENE